MTHYHTGQNIPGYMPMSDEAPYSFERFEDAKADLIQEIKRYEDLCADIEDEDTAEAACAAAEDVNLWSSPDVAYVSSNRPHDLGLAFWIIACDELECVEDDDTEGDFGDDDVQRQLDELDSCTRHGLPSCIDPDCIRARGGSVLAAELADAERWAR